MGKNNLVSNLIVLDLLKKVGNGEIIPRLKDPNRTWRRVSTTSGEVNFILHGIVITIYNNRGDFDYIERIKFPDGREGCYDDWDEEIPEGETRTLDAKSRNITQPTELLLESHNELYFKMEEAFIRAT